jgi:hypothetical protein
MHTLKKFVQGLYLKKLSTQAKKILNVLMVHHLTSCDSVTRTFG